MSNLSGDLDAWRKAQHLKKTIDEHSDTVLFNLVKKISLIEAELEHYRSEQQSGDFMDGNGDLLQAYVK